MSDTPDQGTTAPDPKQTGDVPASETAPPQAASGSPESSEDLLPVLPKGDPLFDGIPTRAVVIEELAPALGDGALVVRRSGEVGVVLVRERNLFETYCFRSKERLYGQAALTLIKSWEDATVSAYRLEPELVDVCPSLLRGEPVYNDLRLGWLDWGQLLADLASRDGTFVVEIRTTVGRGVTCIANGKQIATFTEAHPELGAPTLLDPLAASKAGSIWVRAEPAITEAEAEAAANAAAAPAAPPAPAPVPEPEPERDVAAPAPARSRKAAAAAAPVADAADAAVEDDVDDTDEEASGAPTNPFAAAMTPPAGAPQAPLENPFASVFAAAPAPQMATKTQGGGGGGSGTSVQVLLPELKLIARNRLQRSAARVEAMLDDAAENNKPLDTVLEEIRSLVIRGVMQSSLDDVVDEMRLLAASHAA